MKKTSIFLILILTGFAAAAQELSEISTPPDGDNEKAEVSQWIGPVKISIAYHSPRVHFKGAERTGHIWGELVQYGFFDDGVGPSKAMPWRAGANENTTITFSHDVKVEGKDLKAGTYALFLEVEKTGPWNWIFSNNSTGWAVISTTRRMMRCEYQKVNLEEALTWADKAIEVPFRGASRGREDISTLQTKAAVLTALGRESEADAIMEKALRLPATETISIHQYGMRLLRAGKKEKAMQVFQFNAKQHPEEKFYTYVGLARGYTAAGDKLSAIKNWEIALQNVPEIQKPNRAVYEKALKDLKEN